MRPIDLTPSEMRRGARAPMRTGSIPYILVGALVAVLLGVALLVTTGNQVSEKETDVAQLKRENAAAEQEARRLAPYVQFQSLHEQRLSTIASLANSRFDWERVIRELSLVLPADVWLTELSAAASGQSESGGGSGLSSGIAGPAMELEGCTVGQESVARFVTVLKDIDGVTRVAVASSELPSRGEGEASAAGGESGGGSECRTRENITKFKIVVAFDAAPIPVTAESEGEAAATTAGTAETTSTETESGETESTKGE